MSIVERSPPPSATHTGTTTADAFLDMPLTGVRLIEASAGTGKTFTLATIVTRLVIERGLRIGQILAVTYTEAATQELRERLRRRLQLVARIAAGDALPRDADAGEIALCRQLIERQHRHEDPVALRQRLQQAARELDLAAVHTIHGFCTRVLSDHALEAGQPFHAGDLLGNARELREAVAVDVWRTFAADPDDAITLRALWKRPVDLARDLVELIAAPVLQPDAPLRTDSALPALQAAATALREAYALHRDDARLCIEHALANDVLNRARVREPTLARLWSSLDDWASRSACTPWPHERLDLLTAGTLAGCVRKGRDGSALASPLFDAAQAYIDAHAAHDDWSRGCQLGLLHRVRDMALQRLDQIKRQRGVRSFDDLIDGVAHALDGPQGPALQVQLRDQYRAALVDEFQDTDARQWSIFRRVFGDEARDEPLPGLDSAVAPARFLALIGDPKQAIYRFRGGDVHTYLRARDVAQAAPALLRNFRSRPCLLRAVERLYANAGARAFVDPGIQFHPVEAGGRRGDDACLRGGVAAPALTIRQLHARSDGNGKDFDAETSRRLATRACIEAVHETLALSAAGQLCIDGRAVEPGDLAILVRKHDEALRIQRALAAVGIPAVAAGRSSLFATEQALELLAVFDALLVPTDPTRLNAALATTLFGFDAVRLDALSRDDIARAVQLDRAIHRRDRWLRHGPLAVIEELCAENAPRLLELVDGERRLSDFMQLGEALQQAAQAAHSPQGLVGWLRARIAGADDADPEQQLRLESDARRVQIITVHKSKGLEFPFVFLPFAGIGRDVKTPRWCSVHRDEGRVLHLQPDTDTRQAWLHEAQAEEARLLYVALTRAEHALWLATGPLFARRNTPLDAMLTGLATSAGDGIVVDDRVLAEEALPSLRLATAAVPPPARTPRRTLARDWSIYSFSALARLGTGVVETLLPPQEHEATHDEPARIAEPHDARFAGARFGDVVHAAFETVDFGTWRDWHDGRAPVGQEDALVDAFRGEGYPQADIDAGLPLLTALVGHSLTVRLPEGARLCDLDSSARRAEMEFHFSVEQVGVDALLSTAQAHGLLTTREGFGGRRRLDGLMTGKIDLVYAHAGRYYVLDYKTNRLPDYQPGTLARAMHESEYTLQAAIYSLALHRWLRFRLGAAYDYDTHFGGVRYLFCRGVDAQRSPSPGIHGDRLPPALVDALDVLFAGAGA